MISEAVKSQETDERAQNWPFNSEWGEGRLQAYEENCAFYCLPVRKVQGKHSDMSSNIIIYVIDGVAEQSNVTD